MPRRIKTERDSPMLRYRRVTLYILVISANLFFTLSSSHAGTPRDDIARARKLTASGKHQEAINIYDVILNRWKLSPYTQEILYRKGLCLRALGKFPEAVQTWQALLKKFHYGPWQDDALLDIARTRAFKLKQLDLALEDYQEFVKKFRRSDRLPEALYQMAWIYYTKKEYTKAKALYKSFLKDYPDSSASDRARQWLQRCDQALQAARHASHQSKKKDKASEAKILFQKAESLYSRGNYQDARKAYQKITGNLRFARSGEYEIASYRIGSCLSAEGDYKDAIRAWDELLFRRRESSWADDCLLAAGDTYLEILDKPTYALKAYARLLKDYPKSNLVSQTQHKLGLCYFHLGRFKEAEEIFRRELVGKPGDKKATGLERLIEACQKQRSHLPGGAEGSFGKAARWVKLGDTYFTSRQYDKARDAYQKAVKKETRSKEGAYALMQMARCYKQLGQHQQALKCCKKFLAGYKKSQWTDDVLFMSGKIYMGPLRDKRKAIEKFSEVVDKCPHGEKADVALYFAGMLYYGDGKYSKALRKFETLAREYPKSGFLDNTRKMIKECESKS